MVKQNDSIQEFINERVDRDILSRTSAFKVGALARRLAYEYTLTPKAKESGTMYPEALKVFEEKLPRLHAEVKGGKR